MAKASGGPGSWMIARKGRISPVYWLHRILLCGGRTLPFRNLHQGSEVANLHHFPADADDSQRLPAAQVAAYRSQRRPGQLRQLLAGETDLLVPIHGTAETL